MKYNRQITLWLVRTLWAEAPTEEAALSILSGALEYGFTEKDVTVWPRAEYDLEVYRLNDPPPRPIRRAGDPAWTLHHRVPKARARKLRIPPYRTASRENLTWLTLDENIEEGTTMGEQDQALAMKWRSPRLLSS